MTPSPTSPSGARAGQAPLPVARRLFTGSAESAKQPSKEQEVLRQVDRLLDVASPDAVSIACHLLRENHLSVGPALARLMAAAPNFGAPQRHQQIFWERMLDQGAMEVSLRLKALRENEIAS